MKMWNPNCLKQGCGCIKSTSINFDDFNITKLPLLPEEVTGVEALKAFSHKFLTPYQPTTSRSNVEELQRKVHTLRLQLKTTEEELERMKSG